uniref:UBA domain-containing protein n=1 Tax=Oryza nivara TaxID=4536 RepID=A0A0E0J4W2_ORYNI
MVAGAPVGFVYTSRRREARRQRRVVAIAIAFLLLLRRRALPRRRAPRAIGGGRPRPRARERGARDYRTSRFAELSRMVDWASDSDNDKFEWDTDGEAETSSAPALRNIDAPGPSTRLPQDANGKANGSGALVAEFMGMGFPKEMILKAIKEIGNDNNNLVLLFASGCILNFLFQLLSFLSGDTDTEQLLELLLTYQAIGGDASVGNCSASACAPQTLEVDEEEDDTNWDEYDTAGNCDRTPHSDGSGDEDFFQEMSEKDEKMKSLVNMGFPEDEAKMAIDRCGLDAPVAVLVDSIYASQEAGNGYSANLSDYEDTEFSSFGGRKKTGFVDGSKKRKRYGSGPSGNQVPFDGSHEEPMPLPNPMVGFSLPNERLSLSLWTPSTFVLLPGRGVIFITCRLRTGHLFSQCLPKQYLKPFLIPRGGGLPGIQGGSSTACKLVWQAQSLQSEFVVLWVDSVMYQLHKFRSMSWTNVGNGT